MSPTNIWDKWERRTSETKAYEQPILTVFKLHFLLLVRIDFRSVKYCKVEQK